MKAHIAGRAPCWPLATWLPSPASFPPPPHRSVLPVVRAIRMPTRNLSEIFIQTLEQAVDSVVVIDSRNTVVLFNRAAEGLWGLPRDQVIGHNVSLLVPPDIRGAHDGYNEANRRTGVNKIVGSSRTLHIQRSDGSTRWGSMSISKIEADGEVLYTAFVKDITEQHLQNEKLRLLSLVVDRTD